MAVGPGQGFAERRLSQIGIGAAQRPDQQSVAHRATIDEQELMIAHTAMIGRK